MTKKDDLEQMVVLIDNREQRPFLFPDCLVQQVALKTGDYSIRGFEESICVERKAAEEIYVNFGVQRERFMKECERMSTFERKCIIIENNLDRLMDPPDYTRKKYKMKLKRSHIVGAIGKIVIEYGIPIIFASGRREANELCFQFLKQYYKCKREGRKIPESSEIQAIENDGLNAVIDKQKT